MAARKKRSTRRPARKVRRVRRSTRKGQVRKTARRAYVRRPAARRRRRSNPKRMIIGTPAFRYGLGAVGGAVLAKYVDDNSGAGGQLSFLRPDFLPAALPASAMAAALTLLASVFVVKRARTRQTLVAVGTGMLLPTVAGFAGGAMAGEEIFVKESELRRRPRLAAPTSNYRSSSVYVADLVPG